MVYFLDRTLYQTFSDREMTENEVCFFTDMASACRSGKCYVCGDNQALKFFSEKIPTPLNGIYRALLNRYSEGRALMEKVQKVFVITMNLELCSDLLPDMLRECPCKICVIFLDDAIKWKWNLCSECCLIAENLDDCKFYELIVQYYKMIRGIHGIDIKFHLELGGGTTTASVLQKCVSRDRVLTLCIIDSDQKYGKTRNYSQEPKKGDTLYKVMRTSKKLKIQGNPPHNFLPLDVHEVENLIPLCILTELQNQYPDMKTGVDILLKLKDIDNGLPILYYDLKKGLHSINELPKQAYWHEIFSSLIKSNPDDPLNTVKNTLFDENLIISFFPSVCKNDLLKRASHLIEKKLANEALRINSYLEPHWQNIANAMLTWGCANIPMRS